MVVTPDPKNNSPKKDPSLSTVRRSAIGGFRSDSKRNPKVLIAVLTLQLLAAAIILRTVTFTTSFKEFFRLDQDMVNERITMVETIPIPELPVQAVTEIPENSFEGNLPGPPGPQGETDPASISAPILTPPRDSSSAVARLPVGEAAVVGVVPRYDERLWTLADLDDLREGVRAAAGAGVAGARELDSLITWTLLSARDSLDSIAVLNSIGPRTASWTKTDSKGRTWGLDQSGLRLGKVTIPSALLGLLPMGAQQVMSGNPIEADRSRRLSMAQSDIARFRSAGAGNDQFKMLVEELRERRDRERAVRRRMISKPSSNDVQAEQQGSAPGGIPRP